MAGSALRRLKEKVKQDRIESKKSKGQRSSSKKSQSGESSSFNPFDLKVTKLKHDVIGRRPKGMVGKPAVAKKKSIETRQKSLLPELETMNKSSVFLDRRFGEKDDHLSMEEKMLERFSRERMSAARKKNIYNLEDDGAGDGDDDEDFGGGISLTHKGKSIDQIENFDDFAGSDAGNESDDQLLDRNIVNQMHFAGFADSTKNEKPFGSKARQEAVDSRPKSRNEIMKEIIAKSKMHKYQNQKIKEENMELCDELNDDFDSIRSLLNVDYKEKDKPSMPDKKKYDEKAHFDAVVRELAFEKRAHATDRIKSEEEVAKEAFEKLKKQEEDRIKRMSGIVENSDDDDHEDGDGDDKGNFKKSKRNFSADALNGMNGDEKDELEEDQPLVYKDGVLVNKTLSFRKVSGSANRKLQSFEDDSGEDDFEAEGIDSEEEEDDDEEEEEDDDEEDEDDEEDDDEGSQDVDGDSASEKSLEVEYDEDYDEIKESALSEKEMRKVIEAATKELPYVIDMPENHADFLELVKGRGFDEHKLAIDRIRACHHSSLGSEKKKKLEKLLVILLEHVQYICLNVQPLPKEFLDFMVETISSLSGQFPLAITKCAGKLVQSVFYKVRRDSSEGKLSMPNASILFMFRIFGTIFSCSDLRHAIISPSFLLLCSYLSQAPVKCIRDVVSGLFVCDILLMFVKDSKRYIPEVANFLYAVLLQFCESPEKRSQTANFSFPKRIILSKSVQTKYFFNDGGLSGGNEMEHFDFNVLMQEFKKGKGSGLDGFLEDGKIQFRTCLLKKLLSQLETLLDLWKGSPASIEVFSPLYEVIQTLDNLGPDWETLVEGLQDLLRVERKPLQLQKFKAQPISTYDPDFDLAFSLDRKGRKCRNDKEREEREMAKLKHEYKQEMKGAIRELRKDNSFIAQEQSRKRKERDQAYNSKIKSIYGLISNEGGEFDKEAKRSKRK